MNENKKSFIVVGLGNPGSEYDNTRHNVGFSVIDAFCKKNNLSLKENKKLLAHYIKTNIEINNSNIPIILVKPTTYMNNSGASVLKIINYFSSVDSCGRNYLLVIHDDVSLNLGKIRIAFNSGAGGQHGIESIISQIGNKEFIRIKIGVGPDPGGDKRADYVLSKFTSEEKNIINKIIPITINAIETILEKGINEAMNQFNGLEVVNE